jgi:glycosyltransferase involved in cell wall biosynthesis
MLKFLINKKMGAKMKCKICGSEAKLFSEAIILNKYEIDYFQCSNCGFIQTEEPFWLEEAYSTAIAPSDVGLVFRNIQLSKITSHIIFNLFNHEAKFIDYGAGYGLFVRIMRDAGFDFYWQDKFCQNIFAQGFEVETPKHQNYEYELVTAFEVFEHLVDPLQEIKQILDYSRNILFSTELTPKSNPKPDEWWYFSLEEGQHISLYTSKALSIIADKFNLKFYSNGSSLHLLTDKTISPFIFDNLSQRQTELLSKQSLLQQDYLKAIGKLENSQNFYVKTETKNHEHNLVSTEGMKIAIDCVFFQLYKTGIARLWRSLLEEWADQGFGRHVILLDRAGTAPKIPGIQYRTVPPYDYGSTDADREMIQQVCGQEGADLFISTYYTTPLSTPSVFMAYDMIPEVLGWDMNNPMWQEKHRAIQQASAYLAISENTARDLVRFFPDISPELVRVAPCGVKSIFSPANLEEVNSFRTKYGISKPYFILVGTGGGYKNTILFFQAFAQLYSKQGFDIVCTGSGSLLSPELRTYASGSVVHMLQLSDEELRAAYSGAVSLVYPSKYEGFGLPLLEAMACGCPVITCPNASIPEVAGEAALYVNDMDSNALTNALCDVQKPDIRNSLIAAGLEQVKNFSWSTMAEIVSSVLIEATILPLNLKGINLIIFPDWSQPEEFLGSELGQIIKTIATHPKKNQMTLLIDTRGISEEEANLLLSGVAMNLLIQEDLDFTEGPEISLVRQLDKIQWEALIPRIHGRVILSNENQANLRNVGFHKGRCLSVNEIKSLSTVA